MHDRWVPTHATAAEVRCSDGRVFVGRIFIPEVSANHTGPMRVDEWFNDGKPFFAFLPDDAKAAVFLGKAQVQVLSVTPVMDEIAAAEESAVPGHRIAVEIGDRRIEGFLVVAMPRGQRRVLDSLNRDEMFLTLRAGERWHLVRKTAITRVIEIEEA